MFLFGNTSSGHVLSQTHIIKHFQDRFTIATLMNFLCLNELTRERYLDQVIKPRENSKL